jgi:cell division septum initiation protein DivIVA
MVRRKTRQFLFNIEEFKKQNDQLREQIKKCYEAMAKIPKR